MLSILTTILHNYRSPKIIILLTCYNTNSCIHHQITAKHSTLGATFDKLFQDVKHQKLNLLRLTLRAFLRWAVNGHTSIACLSVCTRPHSHNRSSAGSLPLPLRFQRPVSIATLSPHNWKWVKDILRNS